MNEFGVRITIPVTNEKFDKHPFLPARMCGIKTHKEYMLCPYNKIYELILPHTWIPKNRKEL
jgi:hypothetical protein